MTHLANPVSRLLSAMGIICFVLTVSGCGTKTPNYTPTVEKAENAVRRGLDQWKAGQPPGEVPGTRPLIHVTDGGRKPGQTLESYQILGETRGVSGRTIAVILNLENPTEELRARYIVLGIDPMFVFRQEDFDLLMHWDHHMPAAPAPTDTTNAEPLVTPQEPEAPK